MNDENSPKARRFLKEFQAIRADEFAAGTAGLTAATQKQLATAIAQALEELSRAESVAAGESR
jgi:hypothetical protein